MRRINPDGRSPTKIVGLVCGVYGIYHERTKRRYVGSSIEVQKRLYLHLVQLRKGTHHCGYLQNVWNKYGEEEFSFVLLAKCRPQNLVRLEQTYIDKSSAYKLMNVCLIAGNCLGVKHTDTTKRKMSRSAKRVAADPEERKRRSTQAKRQHREGNLGRQTYPEPKPRICIKCNCSFKRDITPSGNLTQSRYCKSCRPEHKGGYYKYTRTLKGEGRPKRKYAGV